MTYDLSRIIKDAENKWNDKSTQADMVSMYCETHYIYSGHIRIIDQHVRKAMKWKTFIGCRRFNSADIRGLYKIKCDVEGIWVLMHSTDVCDYFALCTPDGKYFRARIVKDTRTLKIAEAKIQGTTHQEYVNKRFHYSKYLYDRCNDVAIPEHIIVALSYGLLDDIPVDKLAITTINHKNRDHFDNRPENLEPVTDKENTLHKIVTNELIELGLFKSMDYRHCEIYKNLDKENKEHYIRALRDADSNSEQVNNNLLDEIVARK